MKTQTAWAFVLVLQYSLCSAIPTDDQQNKEWKDNVGSSIPTEEGLGGVHLNDHVEYPSTDNQVIHKATPDRDGQDQYFHYQDDDINGMQDPDYKIAGTLNGKPTVNNDDNMKVVTMNAIKQDSDNADSAISTEDGNGVKDPVRDEVVAEYGYGEASVPDYNSIVHMMQELSNLNDAFRDHIDTYQDQVERNNNLEIEVQNLQNEVKSLWSPRPSSASASSVAIDTKNETHPNGTSGKESDWFGNSQASEGAVYIRWGRDDCPSTANIVYDGLLAGTRYKDTGGGNYLCLPKTPKYSTTTGSGEWYRHRARVYGVDYEILDFPPFASLHEDDPPCAVCQSTTRSNALMIPARNDCPGRWTREYYGYLMSSAWNENNKEFVCVDVDAQPRPGTAGEGRQGNLYPVEGQCSTSGGGIPCGPYETGKEFTCAVCTK